MDVIAYLTVGDVKALASRDPTIKVLAAHLLQRTGLSDGARVRLLLDHSVVHPGPHMDVFTVAPAPGSPAAVDPVGDTVVKAKCNKYLETTRKLSSPEAHLVFLPLPINALGRLHPITQRVYSYFIERAAERTRSAAITERHEHWAVVGVDPEREPWEDYQMTTYKCNKWRDLATVLQSTLVEKITTTMHRFFRSKQRGLAQAQAVLGMAAKGAVSGTAAGPRRRGRPKGCVARRAARATSDASASHTLSSAEGGLGGGPGAAGRLA
jgi:hypothetical protein